ncbi:MAG: Asp23/Gls24 family envelope stress response protein [Candidatus Dormibacteria bacterium]
MSDALADGVGLQIGEAGDGRDRLGTTRVANDVVAWIAALSALEVAGVHAMYRPGGQSIDRILRRPVAHRGVRVEVDGDTLHLDLWVVMEAGTDLPATGAAVQRRVADAVERMLGLSVVELNVYISEVVFR